MLKRIVGKVIVLMRSGHERKQAYQRFLSLLADSPTVWTVDADGRIRSSQGDCPIIEVFQRITGKYGLADTEHGHDVLWAASRLFLSQDQAFLIMGAADSRMGSCKCMGVRNDLLIALARAQGCVSDESIWWSECQREPVGV